MTGAGLVLAHAGHWATAAAFFGPVVVLPIGLWATTLRGSTESSRVRTHSPSRAGSTGKHERRVP
ncbi:MAG: hypothetical protein H0V81_14415 [Solirubrobacterales bacterium]|nr:hypothetical protein [Solirubrobacterales bacterium]